MPTPPSVIAIVRTDRLGDMVLTLPMFRELRRRFPDARLVLCARSYVADLVEGMELIDNVVWTDTVDGDLPTAMRYHGVDTAFFPRPRPEEVWAAIRGGVRRRIGSAYRWYAPLYTGRVRDHRSDAAFHEAEYNLRMIDAAFGGTSAPPRLVQPRPRPLPEGLPSQAIVLHPGSGGSAHDWPAASFAALAARLADETPYPLVITGTAAEADRCRLVAAACPTAIDTCGSLGLAELIGLLQSSRALVANSTGVLHVAAACGIPVVGLYPSTPAISRFRWGPLSPHATVLDAVGDDMTTIALETVLGAVSTAVA